jgi:hypothetical protein
MKVLKEIFKTKTVNGHTKATLKEHHAGKFIEKPENLEIGTNVTVFQIGTENWWEHGEICKDNGVKKINVYDSSYELNEVEVYLDTHYKQKVV